MIETETIPLNDMRANQEGKVVQITGGAGVVRKLDAMGVEVGGKIKKIGSTLRNGPLVFEIKRTQVAVGRGIAQKILVKIKK